MEMIEPLSLSGLPGRIAGFCCMAGEEKRDGRYLVAPGISQRELSKIVGATPGAVSRVPGRLSRQGVVRSTGREVEVLDREGLTDVAGGGADTAVGSCGIGRRNSGGSLENSEIPMKKGVLRPGAAGIADYAYFLQNNLLRRALTSTPFFNMQVMVMSSIYSSFMFVRLAAASITHINR